MLIYKYICIYGIIYGLLWFNFKSLVMINIGIKNVKTR